MDKEAVGKYRKKPVVVEAMQLPSDSAGFWEVYHWMRDDVAEWDDQPFRIRIRTLEGEMWATEGDWIIKGVKGEFYPCKPDIFAATYEPAERQQPAAQQAEPGSPMKAAADALRRKTELEQAHQDGYRDGFKAAQAMLAKAEQPAEEARGVDGKRINGLLVELDALKADPLMAECAQTIRALLAAPAAATWHAPGCGDGEDCDACLSEAATGAQGLTQEGRNG